MLRFPIIAVGALAMISSAGLAQRGPLRLHPSSSWIVDYGDDSCRLAREFGEGSNKVTLILSQFTPGDWFRVSLIGSPTEARNSLNELKGTLRFGPHEKHHTITALAADFGKLPGLLLTESFRLAPLTPAEIDATRRAREADAYYQLPPVGEAREAAVSWVEVKQATKRDLVLETGSMRAPMDALRECSWDTVRTWGLDIEKEKSLTRPPRAKGEASSWVRSADYPQSMIEADQQAVVNFRIMVDAQGNPTSCHIQASTRPREFDEIVCNATMKRAQFEPALDADGNPIASYWVRTIIFRIR